MFLELAKNSEESVELAAPMPFVSLEEVWQHFLAGSA
jgi:hypothetical protein